MNHIKKITALIISLVFVLFLSGCSKEFIVSFESNGGNQLQPVSVEEGNSITEPEQPLKEGYTFTGWYSDSTMNTPYDFSSPVVGDITLHADWTINQYTITFESKEGSDIFSITRDYGTEITIPNDPIKEGYTFTGWYSDTKLLEPYTFTTMPGQDITVYAGWEPNEHTITYIDWDGTILYEVTIEYGEDLSNISIGDPSRLGYTFIGWNQSLPTIMPNEDVELEAIYVVNQYTISFVSNDGSAVSMITADYQSNVSPPNEPYKEGYTFVGWYSDEALTESYTFTTMPAEDITLYAKWEINSYSITYLDGETAVKTAIYEYNTDLSGFIIPDNPSRVGYTFLGWDIDLPSKMPAYDLTVIAVYSLNQYTISFVKNDDNEVINLTQSYATTVVAPTVTREGYTFNGWFLDECFTQLYTFNTMPAENITLYAKWSINSYSIKYQDEDGTMIKTAVFEYNSDLSEFIVPDDPDKEGYAFSGWGVDLPDYMPAYDLIITAQYPFEITITNDEITIINYVGSELDVIIPNTLEGLPVVSIGARAFEDTNITSIVFPSTITTIGLNAFDDNQLTELVLPEGLATIGNYAFANNSLTSVTIPSTLTSMGSYLFDNNNAAMTVTLSEGLEEIGSYVFRDAYVTSIVFPSTVTTIGLNAFDDNALTTLVLPEGLTTIGNYAFANNALTGVTIPSTLTAMGSFLFDNNAASMTLTLSEGVVNIGALSFKDANISSITFPSTIETIGLNAFEDNNLAELVLPEGITTIGNYAFANNALTSVTIPSTLTTMGSYLFDNNTVAMTLTLAEGLELIGASSFKDANISSINFPSTLDKIGLNAFEDNILTELELPEGLTYISNYSFSGNALISVTIPSTITTMGSYLFDNNRAEMTLTLSEGLVIIGATSFKDSNITNIIFASTITTIGFNAFDDNALTTLVLPEGITTIGNYAFANNPLVSVTIPSTLTTMGSYLFDNNTAAMTLTLSEGVVNIGVSSFKDANISSIVFPNTIVTIGNYAFEDNNLTVLLLPEGLTTVGSYSFDNNTLTSLTIPSTLMNIGSYAFRDNAFTSITINGETTRFNTIWESIGFPLELKPND